MKHALLLLLCLLLASTCAQASDYWFRTGQAVQSAPVVYVDQVTCGEETDALGCFLEIWPGVAGVIVIKKGMPIWLTQCVLDHELMHKEGWRHPLWRLAHLDCGNGNWISGETLAKLEGR